MKNKTDTITAEELDRRFDEGEDISEFLDWSRAERPNLVQRRINVDLPAWMIGALDAESKRIGVTRQSIVKMWLSDRIKTERMEHLRVNEDPAGYRTSASETKNQSG